VDRPEDGLQGGLGLRALSAELDARANEPDRLPLPADAYLTPDGILRRLQGLARTHGGDAERIATTVEGRSVWSFRFGPRRTRGVFLLSLLHACEWVGALSLIDLAERVAERRPDLPLTVVPVANPDGAARAHESALRHTLRFPRGNARGIDLNRNFPPFHHGEGFWSIWPWYRPGPYPESEPETAGIVTLARRIEPAVSLSFHSFGRWFFFPPAHRRKLWAATGRHRASLERVGGARRIGYRSGQLGRWKFWFRAYGTELDFLCHEVDSLAFLVEVSRGGIGAWGPRKLAVPFYSYNPRLPRPWVEDLVPFCEALIETADA
jgi:hypothetical protein